MPLGSLAVVEQFAGGESGPQVGSFDHGCVFVATAGEEQTIPRREQMPQRRTTTASGARDGTRLPRTRADEAQCQRPDRTDDGDDANRPVQSDHWNQNESGQQCARDRHPPC